MVLTTVPAQNAHLRVTLLLRFFIFFQQVLMTPRGLSVQLLFDFHVYIGQHILPLMLEIMSDQDP